MLPPDLESRLDKTISPNDALYPVYERAYDGEQYFLSARAQMEELDGLLHAASGRHLVDHRSIVDYASHYGRLARFFRAAIPDARIVAADVDPAALEFCVNTFRCEPLLLGWHPETQPAKPEHDLIVCSSLLTHTRYAFLDCVLNLWERMLVPGGTLVFTYLGARYVQQWVEGKLDHYVLIDPAVREEHARKFQQDGHAFVSTVDEYGMGFVADELVRQSIDQFPSLNLVLLKAGGENTFGQDVAVVRKIEPRPSPAAV